ncbi:type III secretion system inner rod subunit SctI [Pseudomonas sp. D1-1]|uniref:type III secretion system inner rod subunit SctI n=1 Tax=Pseudomonas sp. D1-1 TaxID=1040793 RepID=UPI003DA85F72
MTISNVNSFRGVAPEHELEMVSAPAQADVDLFDNAMRGNHEPAGLASSLMGAISDRLAGQAELSHQAERAMKSASVSTDPMDILKMSGTLSQYSLQTALTTKVVSKGAQVLDKLTNLQ